MTGARGAAFAVGAAGLAGSAVGALLDLERLLAGWLFAWHVFAGISLGSLSLMMLHDVTDGRWGWPTRPLLGCASSVMPWLALLFVVPMLGVHALYPWARPSHDPLLAHKAVYLNVPFWCVRTLGYLAVTSWAGVAFARRLAPIAAGRGEGPSAPGLALYVFTVSFAAIDWSMSLEPSWYSTVYGLFFVLGNALIALAFLIAVVAFLTRHTGTFAVAQYYDLGGLLLAFVMLLTYVEFGQWVIIWSGNKPEEISWYLHRFEHGWAWPALAMLGLGMFGPFLALLFGSNKRDPRRLGVIAAVVAAFMVVHYFWWIVPSTRAAASLAWTDVAAFAAIGGVWTGLFIGHFARLPASLRGLITGSVTPQTIEKTEAAP